MPDPPEHPNRGTPWTGSQLRSLEALQPIVELACRTTTTLPALSGDGDPAAGLSPRQLQVARLLADAATNAEIARALHISDETAKAHTHAVLTKLRVPSRRHVVGLYDRRRRTSGPLANATVPSDESPATGSRADPVTATELLARVLDWAGEAAGALAGGMAVLSPRLDVVASAALAQPHARRGNPLLAAQIHDEILPPIRLDGYLARIVRDPAQPRVLPFEPPPAELRHAGLPELLTLGRLAPSPLLLVLRLRGRVAALAWLAHDRPSALAGRKALAVVRDMHPLLELAASSICPTGSCSQHASPGSVAVAPPHLTLRQLAVARHAVTGASNAEIARRLGVTEAATKRHMTRVLAKYGVRSRSQLMTRVAADPHDPCNP